MTLKLDYSPDLEHHKSSYSGLGLLSYANSNYAGDIKNRELAIGYVYCLNGVTIPWFK